MDLTSTLVGLRPLDEAAMADAYARQATLTKPPGSLGELEGLGVRLAGLAGRCPPPVSVRPAVAVFAGDHGVYAQGVTPWPQAVTVQMVANFLAGGAVINVLARQIGAEVTVVDVGVAGDLAPHPVLRACKIRRGTRDLAAEPALTRDEAVEAMEIGIATALDLVEAGADCLITGDMGIANTTPAAALVAAFTGAAPAVVTGRGTGIDDDTLARKTKVIEIALARLGGDVSDPVRVLAEVGGLEHAALAGFILGGALRRVPVILDGVIANSAALVATALSPDVVGALVAGHRSAEPGGRAALDHLGLTPLLDLGMRLGEGSGAALAQPLVAAAARVLGEVATFESAGVAQS
jgi:nicotinate-nucleotide--dimethylbenzimidazole phosphoribosyltransferase